MADVPSYCLALKRRGPRNILTPSERKRRKSESNKRYHTTTVTLLHEKRRWEAVKKNYGFNSDSQVATLLLDSYEAYKRLIGVPNMSTCVAESKPEIFASSGDLASNSRQIIESYETYQNLIGVPKMSMCVAESKQENFASSDDLASNSRQIIERNLLDNCRTDHENNLYQKDGESLSLVNVAGKSVDQVQGHNSVFTSKSFLVLKTSLQPTNTIIVNKHNKLHSKVHSLLQHAASKQASTKTGVDSLIQRAESVQPSSKTGVRPYSECLSQALHNRLSAGETNCLSEPYVENLSVPDIKKEFDETIQFQNDYEDLSSNARTGTPVAGINDEDHFDEIKTESVAVCDSENDGSLTDSVSSSENYYVDICSKNQTSSSIVSDRKYLWDDKAESDFSGYESLDDCFVTFAMSDDEPKKKRFGNRPDNDDDDYLPSGCEGDICEAGDCNDDNDNNDDVSEEKDDLTHDSVSRPSDDGIDKPVMTTLNQEYACSYCPQIRSNAEDANAHVLTHYKFHCLHCEKKFLSEQDLKVHGKKHKRNDTDTSFVCLFSGCEYVSKTKTSVAKHTMAAHAKERSYVCAWCSCISRTVSAFNKHVMTNHYVSNKFKDALGMALCFSCGLECRRSSLKEHMLLMHGTPCAPGEEVHTIICDICGEVCKNKRLSWHKIKKHAEKTIPCEFEGCKMLFKAKCFMKTHYKTVHLGIKKFSCSYEECDFLTNRKLMLENHVQSVHLKNRNVPCLWPGCNKSFYHKRHLVVHSRIHTDQKPHSCHLCDYTCRQRTALNWHLKKKHPGEVETSENSSANGGSEKSKDIPVGIPAVTHAKKPGRKKKN